MAKRKKKSPRNKTTSKLSLAKEVSEPATNLWDYIVWIYGLPKIGKTTLSAQFPKAHHFMFEEGAKALRIKKRQVTSWDEWKKYVTLFIRSSFGIATVDVVEIAYEMCIEFILNREGLDEIPDDYGRTHAKIRKEFMSQMRRLLSTGKGAAFISHGVYGTRKSLDGDEIEDLHPLGFSGKTLDMFAGWCDLIGAIHSVRDVRVMQIRGDESVMAGCRLTENFRYTDGTAVKYVPMGSSPEEAHANLMKAFNNEMDSNVLDSIFPKRKKKRRVKRGRRRKS